MKDCNASGANLPAEARLRFLENVVIPANDTAPGASTAWTIRADRAAASPGETASKAALRSSAALNACALIVDDEILIADLWSMVLAELRIPVCGIAATALGAIELARQHRPKVVLMDMRLRGQLDGVDAALVIYEMLGSKMIFITGSKDLAMKSRIEQDHPFDVLFKPVSERQLKATVTRAMVS
jgi:CheY-like chemotaxis protein